MGRAGTRVPSSREQTRRPVVTPRRPVGDPRSWALVVAAFAGVPRPSGGGSGRASSPGPGLVPEPGLRPAVAAVRGASWCTPTGVSCGWRTRTPSPTKPPGAGAPCPPSCPRACSPRRRRLCPPRHDEEDDPTLRAYNAYLAELDRDERRPVATTGREGPRRDRRRDHSRHRTESHCPRRSAARCCATGSSPTPPGSGCWGSPRSSSRSTSSSAHPPGFVAVVHGWVYAIYLVLTLDLAVKARWAPLPTVGVLVAGTIPFLSFVVERAVTARVRRGQRLQSPPPRAAAPGSTAAGSGSESPAAGSGSRESRAPAAQVPAGSGPDRGARRRPSPQAPALPPCATNRAGRTPGRSRSRCSPAPR